MVVSAGPWACSVLNNANANADSSTRKLTISVAIGKHLLFTANHLRMSFSLLLSALNPDSAQ
jgi:hypothetical protein